MKAIFAALVLTLGLSNFAMAEKGGEGQICDINGCRQTSPSEDFWNQWYQKQYGYSYDQGYYGPGEQTPQLPGYGRGYGNGGGGAYGVTASTVYCWGKKATGSKYIVTVKATASKKAAAARKAVAACEQETGVRCVAVCQYRN